MPLSPLHSAHGKHALCETGKRISQLVQSLVREHHCWYHLLWGDAGDARDAPGGPYNFPPGKHLYVLGTFQENGLGVDKAFLS